MATFRVTNNMDSEMHTFIVANSDQDAENIDARHWIINHLDLSKKWTLQRVKIEVGEKMAYNDKAIELRTQMDRAICDYIVFCTGVDMSSIDYSAINESIDDSVTMLGGTPAREEEQ